MTTSPRARYRCRTWKRNRDIAALMIASVVLTVGILWAGEPSLSRKPMSQDELIELALSAAPVHVAKEAAVMLQTEDGRLIEVRKGTNGFICVPAADPNVPTLDPMCMDQAGFQWFTGLMNKESRPAGTAPGIIYMAMGGHGWVKDKKLIPKEEPGAKLVHFPAHWMISWPSVSKTSGLPDCADDPEQTSRPGNTCITEPGSISAFLEIYQDPATMKSP